MIGRPNLSNDIGLSLSWCERAANVAPSMIIMLARRTSKTLLAR